MSITLTFETPEDFLRTLAQHPSVGDTVQGTLDAIFADAAAIRTKPYNDGTVPYDYGTPEQRKELRGKIHALLAKHWMKSKRHHLYEVVLGGAVSLRDDVFPTERSTSWPRATLHEMQKILDALTLYDKIQAI